MIGMKKWNLDWHIKIENRLRRAVYRATKNCNSHEEVKSRLQRIFSHAEKLKWISVPTSEELGIPKYTGPSITIVLNAKEKP